MAEPRQVLVLASTSPQRRAILAQLGIPFVVVPPPFEEDDGPSTDPVGMVRQHARGKARSVLAAAGGRPVLGVDTTVVLDGRTWGKPSTEEEAAAMLRMLSGRTHTVVSGLCLLTEEWEELHHETTRVRFRRLHDREVDAYVRSGEWRGRAGGYAIQGRASAFVEAVEGDFWNVVGLPVPRLAELLLRRLPELYPPEGEG
ncbi:MAG: nucleoside triphosphate pyrophosphatase [Armatimonadota bacterium]|nr:nucleoside triphosphate pyrophosphatase [Armatimonadota bacterium]MDR5676164.1 nucleoside triphosphate pyrophosphatase [Armatimonadota bacterium]MDR5689951.1 nucleoside triphosphate pyrophosphatase [Armatimonadota bacterium]MDR7387299.1 nucleoside triphosphate pyrophosphatase [Armatimonadota bacterium]MDR7390132.1 nucleoside triphosphate pyrophosphatase [Armatimonadota bacterium]